MGRAWMALSGLTPFGMSGNAIAVTVWWFITVGAVLGMGYLSYRFLEQPTMRLSRRWRAHAFPPGALPER